MKSFTMNSILSATPLAIALAIILVISLLRQIVQRRFFHPLRSVPGPWINSLTEIPAALALVRGEQHLYYRWLHEKYGPVVRVSPNELSFVSVGAREEIYGLRKGGLNMEKSPIFLGAVGNVDGQTGVSLALNAEHSRQRRALGYLFTNTALLQQENLLKTHVHKLMAVLKDKAARDQPADVSSWYTYVAFDVMGDLCFAEPFGCLDQASATEWSTSVINVFIAATWTQAIRRLSGVGTHLERLLTSLLVPAKASSWRTTHLNNSRAKTLRRLAAASFSSDIDRRDHPDFIHQILRHADSKNSLSQTEIILNLALFISAGTDTTATTLTGWTYYACTHRAVYTRLAAEVRGAFASADDICWEKARKLRFLEATIFEALRLFPPSAASQQRVVPRGGATVDGYFVPGGMTVAVAPWASTRSGLNFWEPDCFRPERWLVGEEGGERFGGDRLGASLPFGMGPRVCVGRNLALMEMLLVLVHLVWNFDIELDTRGVYGERNRVWGLDGNMRPMKVFHSMTKPELWVRLKEVRR